MDLLRLSTLRHTSSPSHTGFRALCITLCTFCLAEVADVATTAYALSIGDTEQNPIGRAALGSTGPLIYVIKLTAISALALLLWRNRHHRWVLPVALIVTAIPVLSVWANTLTLIGQR